MLTKNQIDNIVNFNLSLLEEALRQTELRLKDALLTKEDLDKKTFSLLSVYLTICTGLFGISKIPVKEIQSLFFSLTFSGTCFFAGIIFLISSLRTNDYGTLGRYPDTWLQEGIIDGGDQIKGYVLANILVDYQEKIKISDESNSKKIKKIDWGLMMGILAPFGFIIILFIEFFSKNL